MRAAVGTAVIAGTAGAVHHHQQEKWDRQDQAEYEQQQAAYDQQQAMYAQQQQAAPPPPPAPAAPDPNGLTAQLTNLSQLHNAGVLSDEEFAAAKAKLLGS